MSYGFEYPGALALLLVIPLFLLLQKRRRSPRALTATLFPFLEQLSGGHRQPPSFFRPKPRTRALIVSVAVTCLSFAASGFFLNIEKRPPLERLVVLENNYSVNALTREGPLKDHLVKVAGEITRGVQKKDTLSLLSLAPSPRLHLDLSAEAFKELFKEAPSGKGWQSLEQNYTLVEELTSGRDLIHTTVLSPRAEKWDRLVSENGPRSSIQVLPTVRTERGNAGIVAFDLRLSSDLEDRYDLSFKVLGLEIPSNIHTVSLYNNGALVRSYMVTLDEQGFSTVESSGLELRHGQIELVLEGRDLLPDDNTVVASVRGPGLVPVRVTTPQNPFLRGAIRAHEGFSLVASDVAAVDVLGGAKVPDLLERPSLIIDPRNSFLNFRYSGISENPGEAEFDPIHPLTRHIAFRNFRPLRTTLFETPSGTAILARAGETPVIVAGEVDGKRTVVWFFDPMAGSMALDPSFVMLVRTTIEWLADVEPVVWSRSTACGPDEGSREGATRPANILCEDVTRGASILDIQGDVPGMTVPRPEPLTGKFHGARLLLVIVLFILSYLLAVDILNGRNLST